MPNLVIIVLALPWGEVINGQIWFGADWAPCYDVTDPPMSSVVFPLSLN